MVFTAANGNSSFSIVGTGISSGPMVQQGIRSVLLVGKGLCRKFHAVVVLTTVEVNRWDCSATCATVDRSSPVLDRTADLLVVG